MQTYKGRHNDVKPLFNAVMQKNKKRNLQQLKKAYPVLFLRPPNVNSQLSCHLIQKQCRLKYLPSLHQRKILNNYLTWFISYQFMLVKNNTRSNYLPLCPNMTSLLSIQTVNDLFTIFKTTKVKASERLRRLIRTVIRTITIVLSIILE